MTLPKSLVFIIDVCKGSWLGPKIVEIAFVSGAD